MRVIYVKKTFWPNIKSKTLGSVKKAYITLLNSAYQLNKRKVSIKRTARILNILSEACFAFEGYFPEHEIIQQIAFHQKSDGGWSDTEETIWCTKLLTLKRDGFEPQINSALGWLQLMQHTDGGWGLTVRDESRIPTTCLSLTLLPEIANDRAIQWVEGEWQKDLYSEVKLTYKGGFILMALANHQVSAHANRLIDRTIDYLNNEQNEDGGYGPWKNHPIGSDPWSTGITLAGLSSWPDKVPSQVIERSVEWLCNNQLDSGLWAYHFIDEGSAYAYWGLIKAIEYLERLTG